MTTPWTLVNLAQYLRPCELRALAREHVISFDIISWELIQSAIIGEINRRLELIFGSQTLSFKKILAKDGALISGSFIIQCILGTEWQESDIDIYTSKYPRRLDFELINDDRSNIGPFLHGDCTYPFTDRYVPRWSYADAFGVVTYTRKDTPNIQVIIVDNPKDFIQDFDLQICRNAYRIDQNMHEFLDVSAFWDIWTMHTSILSCVNMFQGLVDVAKIIRTIKRYMKYSARGFTFTDSLPQLAQIENKLVKVLCDDFRVPSPPLISIETDKEISPDRYDGKLLVRRFGRDHVTKHVQEGEPFWRAVRILEGQTDLLHDPNSAI